MNEERRIQWVIDWVNRMACKYGGTVHDNKGNRYDWGQALARESYGPNWAELVPDSPTYRDITIAKQWEHGRVVDWVVAEWAR